MLPAKCWSQEMTRGTQACHAMGKTAVPTFLQRPVFITSLQINQWETVADLADRERDEVSWAR